MTLGGNVVIRNGNELDFCWREAVASLLPVCDVVSVCDGQSTDGTQEEVRDWMTREPKLSLCVYEWKNPKGYPDFFVDWINYGREHVKADYQFQLDADEVLSELSYPYIQLIKQRSMEKPFSIAMNRLNFWRDTHSLIPKGQCCSAEVIRIAPTNMWMASDGYHPKGEEVAKIGEFVGIDIFHYGFLRKREAFFKKERLLQGYFFDTYDERLAKAETAPGNWMAMEGVTGWENQLKEYTGPHPLVARGWLRERGYDT